MSVTQEQVLGALRAVQDPDLHKDIVSLGFVKEVRICGGAVDFTIELTTPACPVKDQMKAEAERLVQALPGVEVARANGMGIATFSGFQPDNLLRARGDVNFYVNSNQYGFVEVAHHALIQAILDIDVFPRRTAP